ncbi:MAG TPA: PEGA domain-containing protein [Candidatus Binataceae bacterium]
MRIPMRVAAAGVAAIYLCACATLIHGGGQQTVSIATDPSGAKVQVGGQSLVTPAEITLSRDHDYQVVVNKEGYAQEITEIHSRFSWVTVLDLVFIIPWVIDLVSGGGYYLDPETIQLTMAPTANSDIPARRPAPTVPSDD